MPDAAGTVESPLRVAIVGSGPSGFYAAAALFALDGITVQVDMFDRLPTPFGLVRGGVAPDHQKIKNVIRVYNKTAARPGFRFFGNVMLGRDLAVDDLQRCYHQIVLAVGNESDRKMEIPGEELAGVHSATEFVGWYNGHPDFQDREFDLARARRVVVVGNGNVAMDVTRILAEDPAVLARTDITGRALAALRLSAVREVVLLGRRGPAQAAFSPAEIKEIGELKSARLIVSPQDAALDPLSQQSLLGALPSAKKNVDYLAKKAAEYGERPPLDDRRSVVCRFLVSPVEVLGDRGQIRAVRIEHNELVADQRGALRPRGTGRTEEIEADLLFKAVGYLGQPLPGLPFDQRFGTFPNTAGRVLDPANQQPLPGIYVVGWAKRGPSGLIGTNGPDSEATVAAMKEDLDAGSVPPAALPDPQAFVALLGSRGVDPACFADWSRLDADEVGRGQTLGKVREKYTDVPSMMTAIRRLRAAG